MHSVHLLTFSYFAVWNSIVSIWFRHYHCWLCDSCRPGSIYMDEKLLPLTYIIYSVNSVNFCNKFLNRMFFRRGEINISTQKSNRIYMNWWNNFTFKSKGRNINDFTIIFDNIPQFRALKDVLAQIKATAQMSRRTWLAAIDGDIKNISFMKALTGLDVMVL